MRTCFELIWTDRLLVENCMKCDLLVLMNQLSLSSKMHASPSHFQLMLAKWKLKTFFHLQMNLFKCLTPFSFIFWKVLIIFKRAEKIKYNQLLHLFVDHLIPSDCYCFGKQIHFSQNSTYIFSYLFISNHKSLSYCLACSTATVSNSRNIQSTLQASKDNAPVETH